MSRRNGGGSSSNNQRLDLKLNLSPPQRGRRTGSPSRSASLSPTSPPSSCLSSEPNDNSPETTTTSSSSSMVLVGCPRCLMYVMLSENEPKCPKCKSTVLLDFLHNDYNNSSSNNNTRANASTAGKKKDRRS